MTKKKTPDDRWQMIRRLISARLHAKLTQVEAAKRLGLTQGNLSQIENGRRRIDAMSLIAFAKVYKKPIHFFYE
jgi:transcriptional regulator with XRE-family HTH domain